MTQRVISEVHFIKNKITTRKLVFMEDHKDFCVYEMELQENKRTGKDEWHPICISPFPQRNLARAFWIGRLSEAGYEEGNTNA